jgi:hypothetical protein
MIQPIPEFGRHVLIAIAAKFLAQDLFNLKHDYLVLHQFSLFIDAVGAGQYSFRAVGTLVIKAAGSQPGPFQQASDRYTS